MWEMTARTVVIGSGCAALNGADWLAQLGEDVLLVTEGMNSGTSRNTGSDKQTYYKLSLAGDEADSVGEMARTLARPDVHGDVALCEAAGSARCFLKLAALGVPFPTNVYGEYVGYQTDHDTRRRASSAGPLTSRLMTEALEASVCARQVQVEDELLACKILTDEQGVAGLVCLDLQAQDWMLIHCAHVVQCTGGPAGIYRDVVYPESQFGMSGMAFEAGARGINLHCWQYGLASVAFRWNVSGSYQQALPRYVSVDEDGVMREFLADQLGETEAINRTFLKGYQWPFDPSKVEGSSRVDLLVKAETDLGRRVYLDYRQNPRGYHLSAISEEARSYLVNCGAIQDTPIERLRAINAPAIDLYRTHGIDLETDMLEIRVCAQHHNGGIEVDSNWQTSVPGLYVCGEAAGTFGATRPGGTALNSTQVGSMRAAEHIAHDSKRQVHRGAKQPPLTVPTQSDNQTMEFFQGEMSRVAAFQRDEKGMQALRDMGQRLLSTQEPAMLDDPCLADRLRFRDLLLTQQAVLDGMLTALRDDRHAGVLITQQDGSHWEAARPLPERDLWFERVWKTYRQDHP